MKKISALFLVLIIVFSFVGCSTTNEKTATTMETITMSHEDEVNEFVQWAIVNIINKNSVERYGNAQLYEDVKREVVSYISSLPSNLTPENFSIELISSESFEIKIVF